jgi:uncharacterized membrane protein YbaN (DUF454 family)
LIEQRIPLTSAGSVQLSELSVVHSSHGRVRVHLPHWSDTPSDSIVASIQHLVGVVSADANPLTGNVLIRFDPERTSAATLLEMLPRLHVAETLYPVLVRADDGLEPTPLPESGGGQLVAGRTVKCDQTVPVAYMTGTGRVVYIALGWTNVGMAVVGVLVPGIPAAPFVILAGYFFIRSSPEAHSWLRGARWFGPILRDWEAHRGVRRAVRNAALVLIGGSMVLTALLPLATALKATIIAFQALGFGLVLLGLRVVEPVPLEPAGTLTP